MSSRSDTLTFCGAKYFIFAAQIFHRVSDFTFAAGKNFIASNASSGDTFALSYQLFPFCIATKNPLRFFRSGIFIAQYIFTYPQSSSSTVRHSQSSLIYSVSLTFPLTKTTEGFVQAHRYRSAAGALAQAASMTSISQVSN